MEPGTIVQAAFRCEFMQQGIKFTEDLTWMT